jgi:hypothetical protein
VRRYRSANKLFFVRYKQEEHRHLCAGFVGHLFTKSGSYASTIALIFHLAFTKRRIDQETRVHASQCSMNILIPFSSTKQRSNMFSSSVDENWAGNVTPLSQSHLVRGCLICLWRIVSCCHKSAFSAINSDSPLRRSVSVPSKRGCIGYVRRVTHDEIADAVG